MEQCKDKLNFMTSLTISLRRQITPNKVNKRLYFNERLMNDVFIVVNENPPSTLESTMLTVHSAFSFTDV